MNLPAVFLERKAVRGFTLTELLLVIGIMLIIAIFTSPIGISFYQTQLLNETSDGLTSALRSAQSFARSGKHNHSFGVRILSDSYVLFEGDSYASRVVGEDDIFHISGTVVLSGIDEIVFSALDGKPNVVGIISISSGSRGREIEILTSGNIER